jgi:CspA family cold shock protein
MRIHICCLSACVVQNFARTEVDAMARLLGRVKWFNDRKGFGFLTALDNQDVFVHHTAIRGGGFRTLMEGEMVEYEAEAGPKGLKATVVRRLKITSQETQQAHSQADHAAG